MNRFRFSSVVSALAMCVFVAACDNTTGVTNANTAPPPIKINPCGITGTA